MRLLLLLLALLTVGARPPQGPAPTDFIGAWKNTAERPGGPPSLTIEQEGQRIFVSIPGVRPDKVEASVFVTMPDRQAKTGPTAGPLVVNTDERMFILKQAERNVLTLEMYSRVKDRGLRPFLLIETFKKTP